MPTGVDGESTHTMNDPTDLNQNPEHLNPAYRTALITCGLLNLAMLFVEGGAGLWIGSAALLADAVDFLEDASILGLALIAIRWPVRARATAGLVQGLAMAGVGMGALVQVFHRLVYGGAPPSSPMGAVAMLALAVNLYCAYRLVPFRKGDVSMRALWVSTRNDATLNVFTVIAAGLIALTGSAWPDLIAGGIIAAINLWAAMEVVRAAVHQRHMSRQVG